MDGYMDEWTDVKAILRITYSNQKQQVKEEPYVEGSLLSFVKICENFKD